MSIPYKKILLTLDGSEVAAQALPHAEEIARASGAELILFQVVEDLAQFLATPGGVGMAGIGGGTMGVGVVMPHNAIAQDREMHMQAMNEAKASLDGLAVSLHHRKINTTTDIDTGDPATRIVDYAVANDIDLIVMSTHGRTGLARWTYGSVANKVLQAVPCAVLVMRPDDL